LKSCDFGNFRISNKSSCWSEALPLIGKAIIADLEFLQAGEFMKRNYTESTVVKAQMTELGQFGRKHPLMNKEKML
jgi:hypothetical protein